MSYYAEIGKPHNLLFIHIPKTAGTSVASWYKKTYQGYKRLTHAPLDHPILAELNIPSWTIIRNPYDRAFSAYKYRKQILEIFLKQDEKYNKELDVWKTGFSNWIVNYFTNPWLEFDTNKTIYSPLGEGNFAIAMPMTAWLKKNNKLSIDYILRFENLQDEFSIIKKLANTNNNLRHKNSSHVKLDNYKDYYTTESRKIVEKCYQEDLDTFKYLF